MNRIYNISVVIPVFNERDSVRLLTEQLIPVLASLDSYEIIYVDDGSNDGSDDILDIISREYPDIVKIIHLRTNCGKSIALQQGFNEARGELIAMMDADLQDSPEEIPVLVKYLKENNFDVVTGWKYIRQDSITKRLLSLFFNYVMRRSSALNIRDFNCGLKVMRRECLKSLRLYGQLHRFMIILLGAQGFKIGEHKVKHSVRKFGRSKYKTRRRIYEGILDFLTIFFITRYMQSPLYFFGYYGLTCFLVSFLYGGFFLTLHLISVFTYYPQGRLSEHQIWILSPILFLIGVIFIFFGLMGELIYHLFSARLDLGYIQRKVGFEENPEKNNTQKA